MDLDKLAQELGGKPVSDLDALAAELGGEVASTPGGYGPGTFGKDVGKLVGAGAVKGITGAPETVQAAGSAAARDTLFKPTEVLNLVADPRRLANKLVGSVGLPPIFETTKEQPLVPAQVTKEQRAAVDQTLARGKIPQLRQLTEYGNKLSEEIEESISPEMKLAMAESQPTGNIIKALETGDFSEVSMGKNPTALGLTGQAVKVFGSSAPQFIVGMVTKTPTLGAAVGFGQAGAEGIDEARNYIKGMSDEELTKKSEYFRNLIALGYSTNQARQMTEDKAADTAAMAQGTVGALGGAFTSKLLQGGFDKTLLGNVKSRLGKVLQGAGIAGAEGAITELAEGVATDLSIDKTIVREIGVDSFANLVLGAIGEAAPGVVRGAVAPGEKVKGAEAPEVPPAPVTPVTPPAGAAPAIIPEGGFETEEEAAAPPPAPPATEAPEEAPAKKRLLPEKKPNDPAIEAEGMALADELKSLGDDASANGLRSNLERFGGYTEPKQLQYYKDKLLEAQQKAGKAPEMPKETFNTRNFILNYKADKARFEKFLPEAPQQVQDTIAKSDQYIQALTDKINAAGYKVTDVNPTSPQELIKLRRMISGIGGTSFRYLLDAQHVARNNRYANPEKVAQAEKQLAKDFAKVDQLLGAAPTPVEEVAPTPEEMAPKATEVVTEPGMAAAPEVTAEVEPKETRKRSFAESYEPIVNPNELEQKAIEIYKNIKAQNPDADVDEEIQNPNRYHTVVEEENPLGIKVGDLVYTKGNPEPEIAVTVEKNSVKLIDPKTGRGGFSQYDEVSKEPIPHDYKFNFGFGDVDVDISEWNKERNELQFSLYGPGASETGYRSVLAVPFEGKRGTKEFDEFVERVVKANALTKAPKPKKPTKAEQAEINKARQAEKKAAAEAKKAKSAKEEPKPKEKFVTDDEGEKLNFPLFVDLADKGYKVLGFNNPRTYTDKSGNKFRTIEKDGVRLALEPNKVLFKQQGKEYGRVATAIGKSKDVTFEHLIVDPAKRKQGLAKQALQDLIDVADKNGYTLYGEPAQLEKDGMTKEQLSDLYAKYGFVATNESGSPIERKPGAKPVEAKKPEVKEAHVEGKTKEPITSKTIEEAIDKAEAKVDAKKIKQAVKNQFDQAIKKATILTDKAWSETKGLPDEEAYVNISIPGDGKFKVKNNKERLEEFKKRLTAAIPLKEGKPKREPSAASVSAPDVAFKNLVDEGDMEAAIEYAKLQKLDLDPKAGEVKLSPEQRKKIEAFFGTKEKYAEYKREIGKELVVKKEEAKPSKEKPKIADESRIVDVKAVDITPRQVRLLTNQYNKLSDADIATLEEHYGIPNYSDDFLKRIREDVVTYINKGADAVDAAIRSIIAKLQAGLLSVAVVFNPGAFQTPDFDVPRFIEETKTVTAQAPKNADMSEISNQAYSITAPAFIKAKQAFFIADKPNGKIHLFDTDGKFLKSSDALYGKQAGDVLSEQIRTMKIEDMKDVDKITPAGVYNLSVSPSPDYTGGYTLRFNDNKGDLGGIAIHAVYTGNVMEKREAKLASKDPKDKKVSFGCINVDTNFFTGNIIPRIKQMENAGVVVIPDAQERLAMFVKPTLEKVTVPAKEIKAADRAKMVARETPYYNDFTSNIDESYFDKQIVKSRDDKISDYAQARAKTRRITKEVAKYGSDIPLQKELNKMLEIEQELKDYLDATKPVRNTAEDFMARAAKELADGNISPEVEGFIRNTFEKNPAILEGLLLSVRGRKGEGRDSGNFNPYTRLVTLWKDGSGVDNAKTIRHELTHSLEQMMRPETKKVLVEQWARAFEQAMKKHTDKASKAYFDAVLDFLENPSKESFDKATKVMPSYDFYQYINPSEYWAVNAEAMLGAKLGGAWSRFTNAVKKLLEGLKSFFGMNNKYAVHKSMDEILSGDMNRINKETLVDYLLQGKYKIDYLNNVEETDALLDKHSRPVPPIHPSNPVKDAFMGGYSKSKKTVENVLTEPRLATSNMIGRADRAITQQRNKNIFYGTGLELADRERYGGQVRNGHKQAIASVALVNAIHSGHIATQVMTQGKLIFNQDTQMFQADKSDKSMANVVRAKAKLVEKLGDVRAAKVIQAFFEAKRSRSIINEYLDRTAAYENAKAAGITGEDLAELKKDLRNIEIAMQKVQMTDEAIDDFIKLDQKYPELKEMMDNWTSVNQNMIDMMEFSGLISKQRAETLRNIKDYVPWYRVMDDMEDVHSAPGGTRGMTNVAREKKFKAGEVDRDIDDIVDNMIHNVLTLTRNSMRNYAANRIVMEYGTRTEKGKIKVFPSEGTDNDGVRFNIVAAGRRIVVQIKDPLVAEAVIGMENIDIPMFNALAYLANGLRRSITTFPAFQVAQLFMDAPTAALVTGLKNPAAVWSGVFTSFLKNLRKDDPIVAMLRSYGIGGYQSSARTPEKEIQMDIGLIQGSWFSKAMKGLDRFGDASDYAQRRAVYMQTLKETGDELLAIFQANNVIDFQKRGSGGLAQAVTRSVAFMNAYAQSMDVLAKGIAGGGIKGLSRKQAFARMIATGMALSAATIVYCMLVGDDDEYNKLDDQTKMRNIYIPGLDMRLPMHTGASFFFKAVPELLYNKIMKEGTKDEYDKKRLTRALGKAALDSLLGPNITPTGVKPVVEIGLNRNFFTGGQVTPKGMEDLAAFRQYNQNTSELGKIISALTGTEKTRLLNPMEADHLVRGLLGTAGATVMWGSNMLIGNRADPQAKDNPFYGQFIMPDVARGREDLYYDLKSKTDEAYKTHQDLLKKGRKEEAAEWFKENKDLIRVYGYTSSVESNLKELNGEIRRIGDLPEGKMDSKQKRERINELQEIKMRVLRDVISMRKRAGLSESYF